TRTKSKRSFIVGSVRCVKEKDIKDKTAVNSNLKEIKKAREIVIRISVSLNKNAFFILFCGN
ncbi:hypothetical protein DCI78_24940, partial [Salmonella enterica subsp. enterica serovar Kentucky]|nr:hypothetical protein [Salmonella enterica subsp. enterica serovar Kentucky]